MSIHKISLFATLILCSSILGAQDLDSYSFYNISNGISHKRVHAITQGADGFIWVGTYGGLNRFSGIEFDVYEAGGGTHSLPGDEISDLLVASEGTLWVATNNGVAAYNKTQDNFTTFTKEKFPAMSSNVVQALAQSKDGTIWMATSSGVCLYRNQNITKLESIPSILIRTLSIDKSGNIWAGANEETFVVSQNDKLIARLSEMLDGRSFEVTSSEVDDYGNVWLGTRVSGLIKVSDFGHSNAAIELIQYAETSTNKISSNQILDLHYDDSGYLWISTENGLNRLEVTSGTFEQLKNDPNDVESLSGNNVWTTYTDRSGRLWVSAFNQGLDVYDPKHKKFNTVRQKTGNSKGLSNNNVTSFHLDESGMVWVGTDGGGINIWDPQLKVFSKKVHDPTDDSSLGSNAVLDIFKDSSGTIWVATWAGGLNKYVPETDSFVRFDSQSENPISDNNVFKIEEDRYGNLWIGSFGGVDIIGKNGESITNISNDASNGKSIGSNEVLSLLLDKNIAWIGTLDGLSKIDFDSNYSYEVMNFKSNKDDTTSIAANVINDIYKDSQGRIWFATKGGLSTWVPSDKTFLNYTKKDGLPSKEIMGVFEPTPGDYWITTTKGVAKLRFDEGSISQKIAFSESDGLQSDNFLRGSYAISATGTVYLGGSKGFNYVDLQTIKANDELTTVHFTDIKVNNKKLARTLSKQTTSSISNTPAVTLTHLDNVITVGFIGLNYTHPEKNQYAYKLQGFEDEWNFVGNQRFATYTNLDPGSYTLLVKASNNDQVWNEVPASLKIIVLPPWWATWWFRGLCVLILGVLIFSLVRWRTKNARKFREELNRRIDEATSQIKSQNDVLKQEREKLNNAIEETNFTVKKAIESGDFTARIDLINKEGEWKKLGASVNSLFDSITLPFQTITDIIGAMATSNLSMRYEHEARGDVLKLSSSLNYALDSLSKLLSTLVENMAEIGAATEEMLVSGHEMKVGTGEIASSTSELSRGAQEQVSRIDEASHILENILESSASVSTQAQSINEAAEKGAIVSDSGKNQMNNMDSSMQSMLSTSKESSTAITNLSHKSSNISSMLSAIREIAVETNMLALNAAIEAAKAGDAGRGFAVVADQIRKLAENSNHFVLEIENVIKEVQDSIGTTARLISDMGINIEEGVQASQKASSSFNELAASYAHTLGLSNQILSYSEEQHKKIKEVVHLMESVVVISEQAAAGTEEIASSSNQLSSGMNEYIENSAQVSQIIQTLNDQMQQFKLR